MIQVKELVKTFHVGGGEIVALNNVSFEIPTGQFLTITGRSGAGKSTTLYQLGLLDTPSSGSIIIDNDEVTRLDDKKRVRYRRENFGFIFQDYAILPTLSASENVMLPLLMRGVAKSVATQDAANALTKVGLGELLEHLPSQLSGGQQQRVSIARAIVHKPKILFADEPTANLDTESSKVILDIFLDLHKAGQTIVMVTHEPEYAALADRIISLLDGKIVHDMKKKKSSLKNKKL